MPVLDVDRLRAYRVPECPELYDARDTILYALGTGAGLSDQIDELDFVFERNLKTLPTLALVLGTPGFWLMDPRAGLDWRRALLGEQSLVLHRHLQPQGDLVGRTTIGDIADEGLGKTASFRVHRTLSTKSGTLVAEVDEVWVLQEAGGFGGAATLPGTSLKPVPDTNADATLYLPTSRQQAMIYRLSGDRNPLHIDPEIAASGGFDRPVLHGSSTMGLVARAIAHLAGEGDPARLAAISLRFVAPVYPGEMVRTEIWRDGLNIRFKAWVPGRNVLVIDGGRATLTVV